MFLTYIYTCSHESPYKKITSKGYRCPICEKGKLKERKYACDDCGDEFLVTGSGYRFRCSECQKINKEEYREKHRKYVRDYARKVAAGEIVPGKKKKKRGCPAHNCWNRTDCLCTPQFMAWETCTKYEQEIYEYPDRQPRDIYYAGDDRASEMEIIRA